MKKKSTYELSGPYGSLVALLFIYTDTTHSTQVYNEQFEGCEFWCMKKYEHRDIDENMIIYLIFYAFGMFIKFHKRRMKKIKRIWERNRPWWWRWRPPSTFVFLCHCWLCCWCLVLPYCYRLIRSCCTNRTNHDETRTAHITPNTGSHS